MNIQNDNIQEEKTVLLARMLVVAYWIGHERSNDIPVTVSEMMSRGHDGLYWQKFLPLAVEILRSIHP